MIHVYRSHLVGIGSARMLDETCNLSRSPFAENASQPLHVMEHRSLQSTSLTNSCRGFCWLPQPTPVFSSTCELKGRLAIRTSLEKFKFEKRHIHYGLPRILLLSSRKQPDVSRSLRDWQIRVGQRRENGNRPIQQYDRVPANNGNGPSVVLGFQYNARKRTPVHTN